MKLVESDFDKKSGVSICKVKHLNKNYYGTAQLHPEDKDKASNLTGCRYAHTRAEIKALKAEYKQKKEECEVCRKFIKMCKQYKNWDDNSIMAKIIYRQLNVRIKAVNKLAEEISTRMFGLNVAIRQQDTIHQKMLSKND